jgi:hypothetical protein
MDVNKGDRVRVGDDVTIVTVYQIWSQSRQAVILWPNGNKTVCSLDRLRSAESHD